MRSLLLLMGFLLFPALAWAQDAQIQTARQYIGQNAKRFGVTGSALATARVTDAYTSRHTGITHVYLRQQLDGLDVDGANVNVNVTRDGRVLTAGGSFIPGLEAAARSASPALSAEAAVEAAARHLGLAVTAPLEVRERGSGASRATVLSEGGLAREPIPAELVYVPVEDGVRLAWALRIDEVEREHVWAMRVDAATGEVLSQHDMVVYDHWGAPEPAAAPPADLAPRAEAPAGWHPPMALAAGGGPVYNVFPLPFESPSHAGDPMTDLRQLVSDPADPVASPLGWHDTGTTQYTITRGNNAYAYADTRSNNAPSGANNTPDGGASLVFDFPLDLTQAPPTYRLAAVTNLFYWSNVIHDVLYRYGFDEVSGNFQVNNFGNGGAGNDPVLAEAQDGYEVCDDWWTGCRNNANFYTPRDGQSGRMQMFIWTQTSPERDGDFDAGIIAHEYGHGVSNRLTGGPSNVECLRNSEQMGEGWSDFFGMVMTMREGDTGEQRRGVGTYALGQPVTGNGIRPAPYSTDMAINNYTYGRVGSLAVPHGVGFLWATMLWDMTWELIEAHGFDPDIYDANGTAGNQLALQLVMDGLKLQPCSPGFVDGRNAILAADEALTGGANALYIWRAFARRGLGYSASQGSSGSTSDGTEAFDMPPGMQRTLTFAADPEPIPNGELATFTLSFQNGDGLDPLEGVVLSAALPENARFVPGSASDGGVLVGDRVEWPAFEAGTGTTTERSFLVRVEADGETVLYFADDMEDGGDNWVASHGVGSADWATTSNGGYEGSAGWYGQNVGVRSDQYLTLAEPIALTGAAELRFRHRYSFESATSPWDGGVIEISTNGGTTWEDLGDAITENGYTGTISTQYNNPLGGRQAFTNSSGGWIQTVVDLSGYVGEEILIRFRLGTDQSVSADGWYVDDVEISTAPMLVAATACADVTGVPCASTRTLVVEPLEGAPAIEVTVADILLELAPDDSTTIELGVGNTGDRDLDVFLGSDAGWVSGVRLAVAPDSSAFAALTVDAAGMEPGEYEAVLYIVSNAPEHPELTIPLRLTVTGGVASEDAALAGTHRLTAAYPNPFRGAARLSLEVARDQDVRVALYDALGREVARLYEGPLAAGAARVLEVEGGGLAAGVYVVRATGETFTATQRLTVVR